MRWLFENAVSMPRVDRRSFLQGAAALGTGLVVGVRWTDAQAQGSGAAAVMRGDAGAVTFDGFVRIAPDNTVTVLIKHLEMGQGPNTGLATLVAEELDAAWSQMRAESAPANVELYKNLAFGVQGTGGSTAISNSYEQMRRAGAAARHMLVAAAAQTWKVPESEITVSAGVISHARSGRRATFGELADAAGSVAPPKEVRLKDAKQFNLIGRHGARLDSPAKSNGSAVFTLDVDRPGALTVLIAHPPRFGATVQSVDDAAARGIRGVVDVRTLPQGVAVYANGFWAAKRGRDALRVTWDESKAETRGTQQLLADYRAKVGTPGTQAALRGDPAKAVQGAARVIEAEYVFPYLAHAPMEPLDCVLERSNGSCRAWLGSQLQTLDHATIAKTLGLAQDKVSVDTMLAGGSFGRRAQPVSDLAAEAAEALKALGRDGAIKLAWTREDDIRGGRYRPMSVHRIKAAIDAKGEIVSWDQTIAVQSFLRGSPFEGMMKGGIDPTAVEGAQDLPYAIPHFRVGLHLMEVGVPTLWWRSVGHTHTGYATETMIDELLVAAGKDPVEGRLALLKAHPREAGVLAAAAKLAQWNGSKRPGGRARGVAVHKSFDTYVAQIAEVSRGRDGLPRVEQVWCAVDCGVAVNPDVIRAQMEGGIGFGLGAVLFDEITLDAGGVVQSNFHDYRMLRINEMPRVHVTIVASQEKPTGVGEPGVPPIGPAVANAWRALTGSSVRQLPFSRSVA